MKPPSQTDLFSLLQQRDRLTIQLVEKTLNAQSRTDGLSAIVQWTQASSALNRAIAEQINQRKTSL